VCVCVCETGLYFSEKPVKMIVYYKPHFVPDSYRTEMYSLLGCSPDDGGSMHL